MKPINLIIFDLDGTLVDTLDDLTDAVNWMLAHFARPALSVREVRLLVGQGARRLVERALPGASDEDVEAGMAQFLAYNESHIADKTRIYPGVTETLDVLRAQGKRLAVVSNKNVALCRKLLAIFGLESYFAAVLGADSLPFRKPSPEPLLHLVRELGAQSGGTAMVGDSINDIVAGVGAGVVTVGCRYGYGEPAELADADYRIDAFAEILELPVIMQAID